MRGGAPLLQRAQHVPLGVLLCCCMQLLDQLWLEQLVHDEKALALILKQL